LIAEKPAEAGFHSELARRIDAALPQTQCTRCGYPDCASYAQAVASCEAEINQCPPGGAEGVQRLAAITGRPALPLNEAVHGPESFRTVAFIDEQWCIGCTLCLKACPTDAIVGANKLMHTVIEPYCTGCELCVPVCPVDCIQLENASGHKTGWDAWSVDLAQQARERYKAHKLRQRNGSEDEDGAKSTESAEPTTTHAEATNPLPSGSVDDGGAAARKAAIAAALAKARQKLST
jgi:electron transport complex protein RnfB